MRWSPWLSLVLGLILVACTDGARVSGPKPTSEPASAAPPASAAAPPPVAVAVDGPPAAVPRNSDGSLQVLPPGAPSRLPYTLVLDYDDFGPQAMSFGLIGMSWWQWADGGSWEYGDRFDVRVVVHRGIPESAVRAQYPTVEGRSDYRYVSYDDAMAYFDRNIADIEGEPSLEGLRAELRATQARIRQGMSSAPAVPADR